MKKITIIAGGDSLKRRIIGIMVILILITSSGFSISKGNEVHFIDVGQSDCILIKEDNHNYLIDTGAAYYSDYIIKYLKENGVYNIKGIILTHFHDDHYGGLMKICDSIKTEEVCIPNHKDYMGDYFFEALIKKGIKVKYINSQYHLKDGSVNLKAIGPLRYDKKIENNNSLVLQGEIGGIKYLIPGDCEEKEEKDLVSLNLINKCDVLKVPHHMLNTSGTEGFLNAARPEIMIATCNGVDTPDLDTLAKYSRYGPILRSDLNGNIIISKGEKGELIIKTKKS